MEETKAASLTRRGFLAGCGVAAAAVAVPASVAAATTATGPAHLEALRGWYRREVEKLAEELRPRFKAGELRANCDDDYEDDSPLGAPFESTPKGKLEGIVAKRFGVEAKKVSEYGWTGDHAAAFLVLALSPHGIDADGGAVHPVFMASDVAAWDVIDVARARRMYATVAGETAGPEE